jgi:hypothetical protein
MAKLKDKVQNALDEGRILLLGTQVLIGFGYRAFFEERFETLARWVKWAQLLSVALLLVTFCLLSLPATYHRLVARGEDREDVHAFATRVMSFALLPLALALGLDYAVATARTVSPRAAIASAAAAAAVALAAWYVYTLGAAARHRHAEEEGEMERTQVTDKIRHVLTEVRMVLPGAQALLGFQFAVALTRSFDELPYALRLLHLVVLGLIGLSVVLLITPAAYHRIVERGEETEHFHVLASRFVLAAMVPLALALSGDLLIVTYKTAKSYPAALGAAAASLATFFGLWFGVTLAIRRRRERPGPPRRTRAGAISPAPART